MTERPKCLCGATLRDGKHIVGGDPACPSGRIGEYQLRMANGAPLSEILAEHSRELAASIQERADRWTNRGDPMNNAVITGMELAAEHIKPATPGV